MSGEIPPELGKLASLKILALTGNQLSGEIPPGLGKLANLRWALLDDNQLSGKIPPELGKLANLLWAGLNDNQLSGKIPPELDNLTMDLNGNQFDLPSHDDETDREALIDLHNALNGRNWRNQGN